MRKHGTCLKEENLKRETEALIVATHDQAVRTNHIKARFIDKSHVYSECEMYKENRETITHIISGMCSGKWQLQTALSLQCMDKQEIQAREPAWGSFTRRKKAGKI